MFVIATAGHVDHGKSTLVRALTGMEPDRWAEERRRGMTIDLGFAWMRLPSGAQVAFVDVPGHERFATNMLAGVGPVPAALLVIAADEGWAAQTEDHLRALDALGVRHALVAVTRSDLADPSAAAQQARERLATTTLSGARVVGVSGVTGAGLDELRGGLDDLVARLPAADPSARVRLWVDRCFTIRGSGTVVTGTLPEGTIRAGDTLELRGRTVTVRALQSLGCSMTEVSGCARIAVNLRGVERHEVRRGDTVLTPHAWTWSAHIDVRSTCPALPGRVTVHVGSAAVPAVVRTFPEGRHTDGEVMRLRLATPLPLQIGDRVLLRDPGRRAVLGGATVLDPAPPQLSRRGDARARARALRDESGTPDLRNELRRRGAARAEFLESIGVALDGNFRDKAVIADGWLVDAALWEQWRAALEHAVERAPRTELLEKGVTEADAARTLALPDRRLLAHLVAACPGLEHDGGRVRKRHSVAALRPDIAAAVTRLAAALVRDPFNAPEHAELVALGLQRRELGAAAAAGAVLRLPGDIVLLPTAPAQAAERLRELPQPFTLSMAREALSTTRRVAVPLLEHLDALRITERVDESRRRLR